MTRLARQTEGPFPFLKLQRRAVVRAVGSPDASVGVVVRFDWFVGRWPAFASGVSAQFRASIVRSGGWPSGWFELSGKIIFIIILSITDSVKNLRINFIQPCNKFSQKLFSASPRQVPDVVRRRSESACLWERKLTNTKASWEKLKNFCWWQMFSCLADYDLPAKQFSENVLHYSIQLLTLTLSCDRKISTRSEPRWKDLKGNLNKTRATTDADCDSCDD